MSEQLMAWAGEFGNAYTERNRVDWRDRVGAWWTMCRDLPELDSVLEVGANRGHNLKALRMLGLVNSIYAVEPNEQAIREAVESFHRWATLEQVSAESRFDLVMTVGLLIHIPPADLEVTLRKIHQLSRKYILAVEYYADEETMVPYRGVENMLWKRDYEREYLSRFPDLTVIRTGFWGPESGFDSCIWRLLEKP